MPEIVVLDTHIWFWLINQEFQRFPASWRNVIETAPLVGVSAISCYEIVLAQQKRRLQLPCSSEQWLQSALDPSGIRLFPLTGEIACRAVKLTAVHKDPFDRLIIATALVYGAKLASIDGMFSQYPELKDHLMQ